MPLIGIHGDLPEWWNVMLAPVFLVFYPNIVAKSVFAHILIDMAIICYVVLAWKRPELRPNSNFLLYALVGYIGILIISAALGVSLNRSLWGTFQRSTGVMDMVHWTAYAVMLGGLFNVEGRFYAVRIRNNRRPVKHVVFGRTWILLNIGVACVIALIALWQWMVEPGRVGSTLDNPLYLGGYSVVIAMLAIKLLWERWNGQRTIEKQRKESGLVRVGRRPVYGRFGNGYILGLVRYSLPCILLITAVFLSGSRSSVLALAVSIITLGVWYAAGSRRFIFNHWVLGICGGAAFFASVLFVFIYKGASPFQAGGWTDRHEAIRIGLTAFADRPLTGYGPENFVAAFSKHADPERFTRPELQFDSSHNHFVDALVETGIIGLAGLLVLTGAAAWALRRDGFLLAAWLGLTVQLFFLFDTPALNLCWAIILAFAIAETTRKVYDKTKEKTLVKKG